MVQTNPKLAPVMAMNRNERGQIQPSPQIANANPVEDDVVESRQFRRAQARRANKRMRQHMNETVFKKNKKRD